MSTVHTFLLTPRQVELLLFGYIHIQCDELKVEIPVPLIQLMIIWYHEQYIILPFSDKYCSVNAFEFHANKTIIKRVDNRGHKFICADTEPLFEGIHCFRVETTINHGDWVSWGVGENTFIGDDSWDKPNSWNVAHNHWSRGCRRGDSNVDSCSNKNFLRFRGKYYIDILLDCDDGKMNMKLINPCIAEKTYPEIKCEKMPSNKNDFNQNKHFKGYVPQFNIGDMEIEMRLAKIPIHCYGATDLIDIFECKP